MVRTAQGGLIERMQDLGPGQGQVQVRAQSGGFALSWCVEREKEREVGWMAGREGSGFAPVGSPSNWQLLAQNGASKDHAA